MDAFVVRSKRVRVDEADDATPDAAPESKTQRAVEPAGPSCPPHEQTKAAEPLPDLAVLEHLAADSPWRETLRKEFGKQYMRDLDAKLTRERATKTVFPKPEEVFASLNFTPLQDVRVVILGQDPYHGPGQAHGFCFSVQKGVPAPPSLKNIFTELTSDVSGFVAPPHGNLESWARQGVLLLNATLTVRKGEANSHADIGWQTFTDAVIKALNEKTRNVVFILWGGFAQKKGKMISREKHCVIEAAHPSPLSVTKFRGCKVFSKANAYLQKKGLGEIDWCIPR